MHPTPPNTNPPSHRPARPSLGATVPAVLAAWKTARSGGGTWSVNGRIIAGGSKEFYFAPCGTLMVAMPRTTRLPAMTRPATVAEIDDVHDAIAKGHFQIELRPPRGMSEAGRDDGLRREVLHQATGRPLTEAAAEPAEAA